LEIACNLSTQRIPEPSIRSLPTEPFSHNLKSDVVALDAAVKVCMGYISAATKPVLVAGARSKSSVQGFMKLAEALGCGLAVLPDAKGLITESHPQFMGVYWGGISSPQVSDIVESSDLMIFVGPIFSDYTTSGWESLLIPEKMIVIGTTSLTICGRYFGGVDMMALVSALAATVPRRDATMSNFLRYGGRAATTGTSTISLSDESLRLHDIQRILQSEIETMQNLSLIVETGDAWFLGQKLVLPEGSKYHVQMQYGSIGWSVGATLGVALAKRSAESSHGQTIALIGDGSFQMTAQEVSTMIRQNVDVIIILLNNAGYTIEVSLVCFMQPHDGTLAVSVSLLFDDDNSLIK
jgi:pyruvate decarboxylase